MIIDVLTIFPDMFNAVLGESIIKRAQEKGMLKLKLWNLRDWAPNKHKKVDYRPFGGGPGMVMSPVPIFRAMSEILKNNSAHKVCLTPCGIPFTQKLAKKLSGFERLFLLCGHYEGIDERVRKSLIDEEISIGDYVLTGGELPAMVVIDAVTRLLPGVVGDEDSLEEESFHDSLSGGLEYPQYTRPVEYKGMKVPDVLLSGDHKKIQVWRKKQAQSRTHKRRPDLIKKQLKG